MNKQIRDLRDKAIDASFAAIDAISRRDEAHAALKAAKDAVALDAARRKAARKK